MQEHADQPPKLVSWSKLVIGIDQGFGQEQG